MNSNAHPVAVYLAAARASLLPVASACLAILLFCLAIDDLVASGVLRTADVGDPVGCALVLASLTVGAFVSARWAMPDADPALVPTAKRTVRVLVCAFALGGLITIVAVETQHIYRPSYTELLLAVSVALLGLFVATTPLGRRNLDPSALVAADEILPPRPPTPYTPFETGPTTFRLLGGGPALSPDETERDALALEVRVLWGDDVVRVIHVDPPRTLSLRDVGADVFLDDDSVGEGPVVLVSRGRVSLVPPEGSDGARGEPALLQVGTPVRMAVVASKATAYRTAEGAHDTHRTPVVLEVTLVRAGRIVGRSTRGHGSAPFVVCLAVVAALHVAPLVFGASMVARMPEEPGWIDRDTLLLMQRLLNAEAEREAEAMTVEEVSGPHEVPRGCIIWEGQGPADNPENEAHRAPPGNPWGDPDPLDVEPINRATELWHDVIAYRDGSIDRRFRSWGHQADDPDEGFAARPPRWATSEGPTRAERPPSAARVFGVEAQIAGRAWPLYVADVERIVGQNAAHLRGCYERSLRVTPDLAGRVSLAFFVNARGGVEDVRNDRSTMSDPQVVQCVMRELEKLSFPDPFAGRADVRLTMVFHAEPG